MLSPVFPAFLPSHTGQHINQNFVSASLIFINLQHCFSYSVAAESLLLHPSPSVTVGEAREQASGVLGVPLDAVDLKDATGRRLHKNDATFEQYGAQLPIEVSEARGLRGGMPPKQGAMPLCSC